MTASAAWALPAWPVTAGRKVVAVEREQLDVGGGANRRGPRHVAQQRDLAEVRAGALAARRPAVQDEHSTSPE